MYESDYNPSVPIKRPAQPRAPAAKKPKPDPSSVDVEDMAKSKKV